MRNVQQSKGNRKKNEKSSRIISTTIPYNQSNHIRNMSNNNPSKRIETLAYNVLQAAQWSTSSIDSKSKSPTPYLDELEKSLEIHLPPLSGISNDNGGGASGVRTCTVPSNNSNTSTTQEVWTWTPQTDTTSNTYAKETSNDEEIKTLEEYAPYKPQFYRALGDLVRESYHPGSVKHLNNNIDNQSSSEPNDSSYLPTKLFNTQKQTTTQHTSSNNLNEAILSIEQYSSTRHSDAVRITRILLALQQINVGEKYTVIENLLHYCEGLVLQDMDIDQDKSIESNVREQTKTSSTSNQQQVKGNRIPILSSFFNYWSNLSSVEHGIQQLSRRYSTLLPMNVEGYNDYCTYCSTTLGTTTSCVSDSSGGKVTSIGDGGSTGGEWKPSSSSSSSSTSFLGDRAIRIDTLKLRLEDELNVHINGTSSSNKKISMSQGVTSSNSEDGLVDLLTLFYTLSDVTLRGKCRRWMGGYLRSFALGSSGGSMKGASDSTTLDNGLGPSFASFCPLIVPSLVSSSTSSSATTPVGVGMKPVSMTRAVGAPAGSRGGGMIPQQNNPLGMENTSACGVEALLQVLLCIISGFQQLDPSSETTNKSKTKRRSNILRPSHESLLFDVIVPLHKPAGLVLWRDQTPLIGLYHETLVKTIGVFLSLDRKLIGPIVGALLHPDIWPSGEGGNTPKVVLLLHEVDTLIGQLLPSTEETDEHTAILYLSSFDAYLQPLVSRLCVCISSENSRTSERALQYFRNKTFQRLVQRRLGEVGHQFIRALCRCPSREVPWNPTVRKMTHLVLQELEGHYKSEDLFRQACEEAFVGVDLSKSDESNETTSPSKKSGSAKMDAHSTIPVISGNMTSIKGAMGSWKPPSSTSSKEKTSNQPPVIGKGLAPWASSSSGSVSTTTTKASGRKQPPSTITGVAPWAMKNPPRRMVPSSLPTRKASTATPLPRPAKKTSLGSLPLPPTTNGNVEVCIKEDEEMTSDQTPQKSALEEVRTYMTKLKPKEDGEMGSDGVSSWAKAQMEESPVLLPNLKFHDLVFGQELGTGAFSTVKYARLIVKTRTRSSWPEYAVKVVSTQKIEELGYEQSINREIAILRTLSHPGISRLVSSFRFRDGAYLILEYASRGDLHTLLRKNGSLDHDSTRFVIGSVAAALCSIHELGFVYADCKPENILITETGHIKVTDYGGCRPVTDDAKELVKESGKNLLKQLRDGDWKPSNSSRSSSSGEDVVEDDSPEEEDYRIEGTTAYLPPEVVMGGYPTTSADIWALGCVLFQCISGRPPILEDTDDLTRTKIVAFDMNSERQSFFGEFDASTFHNDSKSLIQRMLHRDDKCRPDIQQIAESEFFSGIDIFNLHRKPAHPLDVGTIAPVSDAKWARRQFSSIWAPQPRAYDMHSTIKQASKAGSTGYSRNEPIQEGAEADEDFLPQQKTLLLSKIRE